MVQFLEELQGVATPALSKEELIELEQLRHKVEKLKAKSLKPASDPAKPVASKKKAKKDSDSGSSSDSEVSVSLSLKKMAPLTMLGF